MTGYVEEEDAHVQRLVSVVKTATVLEGVLSKSSVLFCVLCGQKDSMQRTFIKKCFMFTVGNVLSRKAVQPWWRTFRWRRRAWNGGAEMAETTPKRLLCCEFRCTGKVLVEDMSRNKCFPRFEYHMFYVLLSICDLFTHSPSYFWKIKLVI
jgi:hypothetical protein